jgi:hypothetical protein
MIHAVAIQTSGLRINEEAETRMLEALKAVGLRHHSFGCIPFTNELTGWEDFIVEPTFVHCSTKVLRILIDQSVKSNEIFVHATAEHAEALRQSLLAGIFYDPVAFDQATYIKSPYIGQYLLNASARVLPISQVLHEELSYDAFFKPTTDLKAFKGGVVSAGMTLNQFIHEGMVDVSLHEYIEQDGTVLMSQVKDIEREYRFFVVNGRVITGSQYMLHGEVEYDSTVPTTVFDQAQAWALLYEPARAFTLDIAVLSDGRLRIVEYNCINCSGLYHADVSALLNAIVKM